MSVPLRRGGRLYAFVPEAPLDALHRLRADDPIWHQLDVWTHWWWLVDAERSRLRPSDRIRFVSVA